MNTEHIDIGLARYSDWAFTSSVVVMVIALVFLAVELAAAGSRKVADRELVAAGTVSADSATPGLVADAPRRATMFGGLPLPSRPQIEARVRKCVGIFLRGYRAA